MLDTKPDESHAGLNSCAMTYTNLLMPLICVDHHLILMPETG